MKQPVLLLLLAAAAWLLVEPFLHWFIRWQLDPLRFGMACVVLAALGAGSFHAAGRRHAGWSAVFAALAVALNPIWPLDAPARAIAGASIMAGVLLAIYAVRRWK